MSDTIKIQLFNLKGAASEEYAALDRHENAIRRERQPHDPPIPLEETIHDLQNIPDYVDNRLWFAWDLGQTEIISEGYIAMPLDENKHLAQIFISVLPEYRCQGIAKRMLVPIVEVAQANERRQLLVTSNSRVPAGEAFLNRMGATKGLEGHVNQLILADLDCGLIERWLANGQERAGEFVLGLWEGAYPEEQLPAIAHLTDLQNQQPFGTLDIQEFHMTTEQLRQQEQSLFARGFERWTLYLIEKMTGNFVGYTEVGWNPNRPEHLEQFMTGVFPEYRNKGLGRWLKAAMLNKVLKERPQVKYIRTGNADSNAAMLKINHELRFQPYMATALWQVEVSRVLEYLGQVPPAVEPNLQSTAS